MAASYRRLAGYPLARSTPVYRYTQGLPARVTMDDPALNVMTDLKRVKVVTVEPEASVDEAHHKMIIAEVRLLIVTDDADHVLGVITARDIMGEKPVHVTSRERVPRKDVQVHHIMTPRDHLDALEMADVLRARVGDVVTTLREASRQHALVIDRHEEHGDAVVRGIFSLTQIGTQLGVEIPVEGKVQSFAEIEALLAATSP